MRLRPASSAVLAVAAGTALMLAGCGGSGHDPQPGRSSGTASDPSSTSQSGQSSPAPAGPAGSTQPITVEVRRQAVGRPMPGGFIGLSLEYPTLEQYLGTRPRHLDPVFLSLLGALTPRQSPIIRVGGDSTDRTWWPVPGMRRPAAIDFALSRRWTRVARSLARDTGGRLILGINLASGSRRLARIEARRLMSGVGASHVAALEIGNEPDDYGVTAWYWRHGRRVFARPATYSASDYLAQFASWRRAMPGSVALAGPALARTQWMGAALGPELRGPRPLGLVTFHRYPLRECETNPRASDFPTIPRLLTATSSAGLAALVAPYARTASRAHRPFRLDELNSVSCQGRRGVSNTFAAALWMLDTLFNVRAVGVDGVNVHMLPGSAYQAFSVSHAGHRWRASVSPIYYGMLMFARAFPPGARLLGVSAPAGPLKAWATRDRHGRLRIVLINEDPAGTATVRLRIPGSPALLRSQALRAPSLSATRGVSLGGRSFAQSTGTGVLPPARHQPRLVEARGSYSVSVPAASAVLLTR